MAHTRDFYRVSDSASARTQARIIDSLLCSDITKIEDSLTKKHPLFNKYDYDNSELFNGSQPWIGLHQQILQTPYSDFLNLFEFVEKNYSISTIVDIGCAYGRAAFVKSSVFEDANFIGYEIVKERTIYANELIKKYDIRDSIILNENVLETDLVQADLYILYDFSNETDIHHLLEILALKAQEDCEFLIAVKGESTPKILETYFTDFYAVQCPLAPGEFSIYSSFA